MDDEPSTSSSVGTLRGVPLSLTITPPDITDLTNSHPASPHSSLPSPSSPSGDSVSSFPSVSSSFLFSSGPTTPPQIDVDLTGEPPETEGSHELVIPSLTFPSPIRRPTPYGKTIGDVKLLVLSRSGVDAEDFIRVLADEQCEDYVHVGPWENLDLDYLGLEGSGRHISISTDWVEHEDVHGLERYEPQRNINITHLPEYDSHDDPDRLIEAILERIHEPFQSTVSLLNMDQPPNPLLAHMLASSSSPFHTALLILLPNAPSSLDDHIISELSLHVPLIIFPSNIFNPRMNRSGSPLLSTFRPESAHAFRHGLFHTPEVLGTLRLEAVDRFLRWREIERGVESVLDSASGYYPLQTPRVERSLTSYVNPAHVSRDPKGKARATTTSGSGSVRWDQAQWQSQWEGSLSTDVVKTLRRRRGGTSGSHNSRPRKLIERRSTVTATQRPPVPSPPQSLASSMNTNRYLSPPRSEARDDGYFPMSSKEPEKKGDHPPSSIPFDPLHLPSLLLFSWSLLAPLRTRVFSFLPYSNSAVRSGGPRRVWCGDDIRGVLCRNWIGISPCWNVIGE
ncbi:hypothetical protein QCA50_004623 [Cerrena zonata]|uniref:Uncharacterized protein n=1 Tax=Cerrena zonata TaxID=2478898 RepID=A0AAW0GSU1_9APHY